MKPTGLLRSQTVPRVRVEGHEFRAQGRGASPPARGAAAFTRIEQLIVVAIIAILAAIAVPNFLEAQTRSKVSRVKADMRTLATGMESYAVDQSVYPDVDAALLNPPMKFGAEYNRRALALLSTPVAYVSSGMMLDVFNSGPVGASLLSGDFENFLGYANTKEAAPYLPMMGITGTPAQFAMFVEHRYLLQSVGPDRTPFAMMNTPEQNMMLSFLALTDRTTLSYFYDATNGTVSVGDLVRTAKGQL